MILFGMDNDSCIITENFCEIKLFGDLQMANGVIILLK